MNSRECILASINHKEPDRVPIDLGSTPSSGISAVAYKNLKKYLELEYDRGNYNINSDQKGHIRVYDVVQQVAQPEIEILEGFNVDVLDIGRAFNTEDEDWQNFVLPDGNKVEYPSWFNPVAQSDGSLHAYISADSGLTSSSKILVGKMPQGATFFDQMVFPYQEGYPRDYKNISEDMGKVIWAALPHSPWDHAKDSDFWLQLRQKAIYLRENADKALVIVCGCNLFEWGTFLRRMDNFLMDLYTEQFEVERLLDALMEQHMFTLEKVCSAVGDIVDIIRFGDDLGMDSGPFMSPEVYRKLFKPRHTELCSYVKKHSSMHTFLHSCGSIYRLIPDLIEAGFEIINPVQTNCFEMEPERLKREFGKDLTFWGGGVDTRFTLNHGTPEQVKEEVKNNLEIFLPGGGFVFNTIHNIMPDVPPENIIAMFEAVNEF